MTTPFAKSRRILLYGDFRSPHAIGMRDGLIAAGHDVRAVSSEVVDLEDVISPSDRLSKARMAGAAQVHSGQTTNGTRMARFVSSSQVLHTLMSVARIPSRSLLLRRSARSFRPDLVHALRLPYEGLTALTVFPRLPVVVSTWGLDFEPMAAHDPLLRLWMRVSLRTAAGIHVDSPADYPRAVALGLPLRAPQILAAGNFGLDVDLFSSDGSRERNLIVYPRRAVSNINYRGFVRAVLALNVPDTFRVVGVGLEEVRQELLDEFGEVALEKIELTGRMSREEFATLIRRADIVVSPAESDGTPNTVIEAYMAGCELVVGRLSQFETLNEDGMAMTLIDPTSWPEIRHALESILSGPGRTSRQRTLPEAFDRVANRTRFSAFYSSVLAPTDTSGG